ncbi:unnamed protein product [Microthlaspi erraticum]|uniref:Uncharacterized protein n=1 Tax=Microthlaspi erraticum TaxID=1685480 RepID=A0A6D2J5Y8_9BRAS|nr:unnamed protein product [Microthlaspi erraticum]CAA7036412.1 unnamed protein product [Microthlaspi erraticum]
MLEGPNRSDLELPLARHDLSVDTGDANTGVKAGLVVCIHYVTTNGFVGTHTRDQMMIIGLPGSQGNHQQANQLARLTSFCINAYSCSVPYHMNHRERVSESACMIDLQKYQKRKKSLARLLINNVGVAEDLGGVVPLV